MSTRCAICQNYTFQTGKLAREALGICKLGSKHTFMGLIERKCEAFKEVPPEQMQARTDWEKQT